MVKGMVIGKREWKFSLVTLIALNAIPTQETKIPASLRIVGNSFFNDVFTHYMIACDFLTLAKELETSYKYLIQMISAISILLLLSSNQLFDVYIILIIKPGN